MLREEEIKILIDVKAEVKAKECINCGSLVKRTSKRPYEVVCKCSE